MYEVNRNRTRHHKMCEFTVAYPVQSLQILSDMRLAIGHQSGFTAYFLQGEAQAMCKWFAQPCMRHTSQSVDRSIIRCFFLIKISIS